MKDKNECLEENITQNRNNNDNTIKDKNEIVNNEEIDESKLEKIKTEIIEVKKNKKLDPKKTKIYKLIFENVILAIIATLYFSLVLLGYQKIPTIEFINDLKAFIIFELVISVFIFERSYSKDSEKLFLNGIEMAFIGGITIFIVDIYSKNNEFFVYYISAIIGVVVLYYLIKSVIIRIIKNN